VREAFSTLILTTVLNDAMPDFLERQDKLIDIMNAGDTIGLRAVMEAFFSSIPHDWYRNNPIRRFEGYYASVVYAWFASLGYEIIAEDSTNKGRIDLTVKTKKGIWLFEAKVKGLDRSGDMSPLEQLVKKGYAEKYRAVIGNDGSVLPLRQIGIVFDAESRNIEAWEVAE
jgi:hypothetical protein